MKFLVPNYSCLQNPWLRGSRPQIPVLSVLNWICWTPPAPRKKFLCTPLESANFPESRDTEKLQLGLIGTDRTSKETCSCLDRLAVGQLKALGLSKAIGCLSRWASEGWRGKWGSELEGGCRTSGGKPYRGRSIGDQERAPYIGVSQRNFLWFAH